MQPVLHFAKAFAASSVDREAGVIRGVAVITEGPALGHGLLVDAKTVSQVLAAASEFQNGLKVKMTHAGDAGDIIGALRNFRIDGKILRADLYPLKSYEKREYVFELAETMPDTFGMSISFSGSDELKDGKAYARCTEIYSCDLVAEPAANPSGLFSSLTKTSKLMTPEDIKSAVDSAMSAALEPVLSRLAKLETPPVAPDAEGIKEEMNARLAKAAELGAIAALKQFSAGAPAPAAPSAAATAPAPEKKFEELVRDLKAGGKPHNEAVRTAMSSNQAAYSAYLARVQSGEVIMF